MYKALLFDSIYPARHWLPDLVLWTASCPGEMISRDSVVVSIVIRKTARLFDSSPTGDLWSQLRPSPLPAEREPEFSSQIVICCVVESLVHCCRVPFYSTQLDQDRIVTIMRSAVERGPELPEPRSLRPPNS